MPKLYELTDAYAGLVARLDDCETDEEALYILEQINAVTGDIEAKAENYARLRLNLKAQADELSAQAGIFKAESERLTSKAKAKENCIKRLNEYLLFAMEVAGLKQIPTSIGKFYTQSTVSVEVTDAWEVPERFTAAQPPKVDRNAIKKAFAETGELYPGTVINVTNGIRFR